jgi:anaerobic selenocysteine-containing dehydrogenase
MSKVKIGRREFLKLSAVTGLATGALAAFHLKGLVQTETNPPPDVKVFPGLCFECHRQCGVQVQVRDGRVVKVEGEPKSFNQGALCAKGQSTIQNLYHPERLNYPLKRTRPKGELDPGWVRISWDEALTTIADKINEVVAKYGPHAVANGQGTGRYSNPLSARWKNSIGSPNTMGPNHVCRGPMAATVCLSVGHHMRADFGTSRCLVFWGRNEVWSHAGASNPAIIGNLIDRGAKMIVVDPRFENPMAAKADIYLPVRPGSDGALFLSFINVIIEEELYDKDFVSNWTNGPMLVRQDNMELLKEGDVVPDGDSRDFLLYPDSITNRADRPTLMVWDTVTNSPQVVDTPGVVPALFGSFTVNGIDVKPVFQMLSDRAAEYPPEVAADICWTGSADKIRQAARLYAQSESACTDVGSFGYQGIEGGHTNTFQTIRAEVCMSAITGNIDKPGGDLGHPHWTWITGEWKRDGGPRSMTPWGAPDDDIDIVEEGPHVTEPALNEYPLQPGLPSMIGAFKAMKSSEPYPIKVYTMVQGNPLGGWCEDQNAVYESFKACEFMADMDLYLTPTGNMCDIVLPAGLGPFERGENKIIQPMYERWADEKFYVLIGNRLNPDFWPWRSEEEYWGWRNKTIGGNIGRAKAAGFPIERGAPAPKLDFFKDIDANTGKPIGFPTPTGKVELYSVITKQNGFDSLPNYVEPAISPYSQPEMAQEYPLVLSTGARLPVYYHSEHRANPYQRELYPHPQLEIHPDTAAQYGIQHDDWIWIETKTGKIRMKAKVTSGIMPGVVSTKHGWWQGCRELGLPGYGWDGANANVLVSADEHDTALGVPGTRSQLCKVYKADQPPYVWDPPYYGSSVPKELWGPDIFPEQPRQEV